MSKKQAAMVVGAIALISIGLLALKAERSLVEVLKISMAPLMASNTGRVKTKPVCSQAIVPTGADCIPQHMAGLPPDPGEAGKGTIDGIITNKEGVRDDVYRMIHDTWPDSERTRRVMYGVAKSQQLQVHHGADLGREGSKKLVPQIMNSTVCYGRTETPALQRQKAFQLVQIKVMNTPERWLRAQQFNEQLANNVFDMPDDNLAGVCGFDPAALPN